MIDKIKGIITAELKLAETKIWSRIEPILQAEISNCTSEADNDFIFAEEDVQPIPLPENPNYRTTLELYKNGESLAAISRMLGVSLQTVKRYYNWLARNGYVDIQAKELTEKEIDVTNLLYEQGKSLTEAASFLNCSVSNITHLRNSALQKGYIPGYIIKILYPGFYKYISSPVIGFPKRSKSLAERMSIGQNCFIYITNPEKKIIALVKIISNMYEGPQPRWPYEFKVDFIIPPKPGVTLKSVDIDFRPRPGDTYMPINNQKANEIISLLKNQPDLTPSQLSVLYDKYKNI